MRVTGGNLKGLSIEGKFPSHVRPTTDMMREAVFNKLSHTKGIEDAEVLDLFCGTGMVSLEFISRGAKHVTSVDKDPKNIANIKDFIQKKSLAPWTAQRMDVFSFIKNCKARFDIIYADPPYDMKDFVSLPELLMPLLQPEGWLLLEHRPGMQFQRIPLEIRKHGSTAIAIFAA